jgi:hypothetical protein
MALKAMGESSSSATLTMEKLAPQMRARATRLRVVRRSGRAADCGGRELTVGLEVFDVGEVSWATSVPFGLNEVFSPDYRNLDTIDLDRRATMPRAFEVHTADVCEDIDAERCDPDLKDEVAGGKVLGSKLMEWSPESFESSPDPLCVGRRRAHPDVEVPRRARASIDTHGMSTYDEEFSPRVAQRGQHFAEVALHDPRP